MELKAPAATPVTEPKPRRWTREEYHQIADLGLFDGRHVELIGGEIVEMSPQKETHFLAISLGEDALRQAFGPGYYVRPQGPLALGTDAEPEPDLAVVVGSPRDYTDHPTTALLVVEISGTTLAYDRSTKASLYAGAGIADYWILNLISRQLEVHRRPIADPAQPHGFRYTDVTIHGETETVSPLAAPQSMVAVRDLLP